MKPWRVEHRFSYGWDDAGWTTDGAPDRFETKREAEAAIDEFIADTADAFRIGYLASAYNRRNYRARKETK